MISESSIKAEITENNYKLLCQVKVDDEDYEKLIDYAWRKSKVVYMAVLPRPDLMLSLALVQVAIRKYKEGKYWKCFLEAIDEDISSAKLNYLGQIFIKTIKAYDLFEFKREGNSSQMYVENIKAHAFVTNYYMKGFFDFSYAFFENNLFRALSDDLRDDLDELSHFMESTLSSGKEDVISGDELNKASKSYKLLKSTRAVFAYCDIGVLYKIYYPIISMIDTYFYDNEIPDVCTNRYEKEFRNWCISEQSGEKERRKRSVSDRRVYSHKPYIKVEVDMEYAFIVIPPQKLRTTECNGEAEVLVTVSGHQKSMPLELYRSFGIYISEELKIPIPSVFDEVDIVINGMDERSFRFPAGVYRIFNDEWNSIKKFAIGHNYLLVKKGTDVSWSDIDVLLDATNEYRNWDYYSANINDSTICYVGKKPLSVIGEFSINPIFDEVVTSFDVACDGAKLLVSRAHPGISFVVDKKRVDGTQIIINNSRYPLKTIKGKNVYDWPEDKSKMAINIILDELLDKNDGEYDIWLDIPGETTRNICKYLLLNEFNCKLDKDLYIYVEEAYLVVKKSGHKVIPYADDWEIEFDNEQTILFRIPLKGDERGISYMLEVSDKEYTVTLPINILEYGFAATSLSAKKAEYLWYSELGEQLYMRIPGAEDVYAYWMKERKNSVYAEELGDNLFRIDMSEIKRRVNDEYKRKWQYINVNYSWPNGKKYSVPLPGILRNLIVEPFFKLSYDGMVFMDLNLMGKSELYVDIYDYHTHEHIVDNRLIFSGRNDFPELSFDGFYDIAPRMEEGDEFGFSSVTTDMKIMRGVGCLDRDNMVGCRLQIKDIIYDEEPLTFEYTYLIETTEKIDVDVYVGAIYRVQKGPEGREMWDTKRIFGTVRIKIYQNDEEVKFTMDMFSKDEDDWLSLYYDRARHFLLGCDNRLLDSLKDYNRFVTLDEDMTEFIVDVTKLRRVR